MIRKDFELVWEHTLDQTHKSKNIITSDKQSTFDLIKTALVEASKAKGETFVIKLTEDIIANEALLDNFAENISILKALGINVVIVHDHGKLVYDTLKEFGVHEKFINGNIVTDYKTMQIIEMVLSGYISKKIVSRLSAFGQNAIGISGKDTNMIEAHNIKLTKPRNDTDKIIDIGFIGEPVLINPEILVELEESNIIPVISPIATNQNGSTYLIDTNLTAAIIASALSAEKLIFFSEEGPLKLNDKVVHNLTLEEFKNLINKNRFENNKNGLVEAAVSAIENTSNIVHIIDSKHKDLIFIDIFTSSKTGSMIKNYKDIL